MDGKAPCCPLDTSWEQCPNTSTCAPRTHSAHFPPLAPLGFPLLPSSGDSVGACSHSGQCLLTSPSLVPSIET